MEFFCNTIPAVNCFSASRRAAAEGVSLGGGRDDLHFAFGDRAKSKLLLVLRQTLCCSVHYAGE